MNERYVLIDSNVFIALVAEEDALHKGAISSWENLKLSSSLLITSNVVISETITVLSLRTGKLDALRFINMIYNSQITTVLRSNEEDELLAVAIFKKAESKNISFADCLTLALMKVHQVSTLLTFDVQLQKMAKKSGLSLF